MSVKRDTRPLDTEEDDEEVLGAEDEFEDDEFQGTFSCKYCEFETPNIDDLDEHIITHDEAILEEEGEETNSLDEASSNPKDDHGEPSARGQGYEICVKRPRQTLPAFYEECANKPNKKVFVCPYCGYQSMKKLDMNKHVKGHRAPVEVPIYACAECRYTTRRKCDMPKHLLTHCKDGSVQMFKCNECTYATKRKGDLSKHMLCHSKPSMNIFTCTECPYTSKRPGDLKKHLVCHDNDGGATARSTLIFNCTECGYTSRRLNDLHKHAVLHCDRTVKGVFKCTKCDYASSIGNPFAKHVLSQCKIKEMPESIFPKDNTMQEYIVLEEEELHLYQLDKASIASVEVPEKNATVSKPGRKRKIPKQNQYDSPKKANLNYYVDVNDDGFEDTNIEAESSKVVVLPGYDEDSEQNVEN